MLKRISSMAAALQKRPEVSSRKLIVGCAAFIILANNGALFSALSERTNITAPAGAAFVFSAYLLLIALLCSFFFITGHRYTLKPVVIFFLGLSAILSYFSQQLGVVFDIDMIRNVAETIRDNNRQEAAELISYPLFLHLTLLGVLPSLLVAYLRPIYGKAVWEGLWRLGYVCAMLAAVGLLVWANYKFTSFFVRENREIRVYAIPTYPIFALQKYAKEHFKGSEEPFKVIGQDASQVKNGTKRTIGIMVVGETARADHFSLNGYERLTNPLLAQENIVNFTNVRAAGTSTAYSVPAMFSFLSPKNYTPEKADAQSNVLDILNHAGVRVVWIENNSSSKGVADRIETIDLRKNADPAAPLYSDGGYFDEALVAYMDQCIDSASDDVLVVMHTMGSHGPTYHKRYPESFAKFQPDCQSSSPQECESEEVINAYDNTILYTDYVLSGLIGYLKQRTGNQNSFLFYASDHGESLGEEGVYLHGLPPFLAPKAQTHVPMIAWFSDYSMFNFGADDKSMITTVDVALGHANIPHTLLGLFGVSTDLYEEELDVFNSFRLPNESLSK